MVANPYAEDIAARDGIYGYATLDKKEIGKVHLGHESFKLDKIYTDSAKQTLEEVETMKNEDVIDSLIENSPETKTQKVYLRKLWRAALS